MSKALSLLRTSDFDTTSLQIKRISIGLEEGGYTWLQGIAREGFQVSRLAVSGSPLLLIAF